MLKEKNFYKLTIKKYYYYDEHETQTRLCVINYDTLNNCKEIVYNNRAESYGWTGDSKQLNYSVFTIGTIDSIPPVFDPFTYKFN